MITCVPDTSTPTVPKMSSRSNADARERSGCRRTAERSNTPLLFTDFAVWYVKLFQLQLYICGQPMSGPEFEGDIFSCGEGQIVGVEFGEQITYQCVDETMGKSLRAYH